MDEKLYIQDIIDALAERQEIRQTEAEAFVKTVFDIIKDALETDKIVKIKGLGTFKLTEVDSRESVDVNTGERIRIESHTKISFVPDMQMRDQINKPFSHFETVILNENVNFEDMPAAISEDEEKEDSGETVTEEVPMPVLPKEETVKNHHHSALFYGLSIAFIGILLVCGVIFFVYHKGILNNDMNETIAFGPIDIKQEKTDVPKNDPAATTDTVPATVKVLTEETDTTRTSITGVRKGSNTVIADSTSYVIVGTMSVYKIGTGETLTMVSKRFYETKDLWPYIVMHNRNVIKNPNRVPSGTVIRIPALRDKKK